MTQRQADRLLKFLYLTGYEMVQVDLAINSEALDMIYDAKSEFIGRDIPELMRQIHFRVMNAESDLRSIGTSKEIKTYKQLVACEKLIDQYLKDMLTV